SIRLGSFTCRHCSQSVSQWSMSPTILVAPLGRNTVPVGTDRPGSPLLSVISASASLASMSIPEPYSELLSYVNSHIGSVCGVRSYEQNTRRAAEKRLVAHQVDPIDRDLFLGPLTDR